MWSPSLQRESAGKRLPFALERTGGRPARSREGGRRPFPVGRGLELLFPLAWMVVGWAGCHGGPASGGVDAALQESVAQVILREEFGGAAPGDLSAEGIVMAAGAGLDGAGRPSPPFRVWRVQKGQLAAVEEEVLREALGADRSRWPPQTLLFAVFPETAARLRVEVVTHYARGMTEKSRGGNAQRWTLDRQGARWGVSGKKSLAYWD